MTNPKYRQNGFDKQLAHFIEECGEALAAAGKTQRWGLESTNPEDFFSETNQEWLIREIKDVIETGQRVLRTLEGK